MDRFIELETDQEQIKNRDLKSNMDRFIALIRGSIERYRAYLKSNMDRFIEYNKRYRAKNKDI